MFAILIFLLSVLFFYQFLFKPQQYWKNKHVKQNFPIPLLGDNLWTVTGKEAMINMVKRMYNQFKGERYVGVYQTTQPTLLIRDPNLIKQLTIKDFDHFVDHREFAPEATEPIWSKNLFSLKGDTWRDMRATLSPTFTASKMRAMFVLMEKSAQQYIDFYFGQNKPVVEIELKDSLTRYANDVIANCAFGIKCDSLKEPENEFYLSGKDVTNFTGFWRSFKFMFYAMAPKVAAFLGINVFSRKVTIFFKKLVQDTIKLREAQQIIRPDMIHLMMEARKGRLEFEESSEKQDAGFATVEESEIGKKHQNQRLAMTDDDIAAQVLVFFFAGFETISTMMSFTCYELALNPDIQERLRQEIETTLRENNGEINYDVLNKMKYMDMVVSESMRRHPPIQFFDRVCTREYTIQPELPYEHPVTLQPGVVLWIPPAGLHSDSEYYPNPTKFDPERFSDENKINIKPYTYVPFGSGPRNCIGSRFALMECKTLLFHVLKKMELIVIDKTTTPIKYAKDSFNPAIEGGCWIGFKRRQ